MAITFGKVWRGFLDIAWIVPGNILAPPFYIICFLILQLSSRFFGNGQNIQEFSRLFIDLAKLSLFPRWTNTIESRKKDKKYDQNSKYIYIVLCGIPSFIYHMFCVIVNTFLCIFIFPSVIGFPFLKIHLRLAFIEFYPFKYEFIHEMPHLNLDETDNESEYSRRSSAYSSRGSTPTPTSRLALK